MMGLPRRMHWFAWFLVCFIMSLLTTLIITVLLCVNFKSGAVFTHTEFFYVFLTLLFYNVALITMVFCLSTFFTNGSWSFDFFSFGSE